MNGTADAPGQATAPQRPQDAARSFLASPIAPRTWRANIAIGLGLGIAVFSFSVVATFFSMGGSLLFMLIGIPFIAIGIECARAFARVERWRMTLVDGRTLRPHRYRPVDHDLQAPYGPWLRQWAEGEFLDPSRWLDVAYVFVALPLAIIEFTVSVTLWVLAIAFVATPLLFAAVRSLPAHLILERVAIGGTQLGILLVVIGLVLLPVAASVSWALMILHRAVVEGLLCVSPSDALRQDVQRLRGSRSATLELEASELRRIERDLHDGAQQRLVMMAIDLGLAEERIDKDPAAAKELIADAREQARQALAELRDVVRGVAPSILIDRGLVAAMGAVAGRSPVPTFVDSTLAVGERLPHAVERAAYFVVTEALANVAKHSSARRCDVSLRLDAGRLQVEIRDDGVGGAAVAPGGGLAGLRDRVQALDGTLDVSSPAGGPTVVRVMMPSGPG